MISLAPLDLIVAVGRGGLIGKTGGRLGLPWHFPEDLHHFKRVTMNRPIIMGRTTHENIGKPLPKRRNIVLSRTYKHINGVNVFASLEAALESTRDEHAVIIGGARVYEAALPQVTRIYWTDVDREGEGDVFFPDLGDTFEETSRQPGDTPGLTFRVLDRSRDR